MLLLLLHTPEGISELMCHPTETDDALSAQSGYATPRQDELEILTHASVREVIQSEFIQLINFKDIKPARSSVD